MTLIINGYSIFSNDPASAVAAVAFLEAKHAEHVAKGSKPSEGGNRRFPS